MAFWDKEYRREFCMFAALLVGVAGLSVAGLGLSHNLGYWPHGNTVQPTLQSQPSNQNNNPAPTPGGSFMQWLIFALVNGSVLAVGVLYYLGRRAGPGSMTQTISLTPEGKPRLPTLRVAFADDDFHIVIVDDRIYIRVNVQNTGDAVARACRVYLTSIKELYHGGSTKTVLDDSKLTIWAGHSHTPLDIYQDTQKYADIVQIFKDKPGWFFFLQGGLFAHEEKLRVYRGTYRIEITVASENAASALCEVDVTYNGDWRSVRAILAPATQPLSLALPPGKQSRTEATHAD